MSEEYEKYLEGNYDVGKEEEQRAEDIKEAIALVKEVKKEQEKAAANEKKRLLEQFGIAKKDLDKLFADYAEKDLFDEYLVDGAILKCNQATTENFTLPNGEEVILTKQESDEECCQTVLNVTENPISANRLIYATVKDTVLYRNIIPPKCNCKLKADRDEEVKKIMADPERNKNGVCRHLMRLNEEWDNMEVSGTKYMTKSNVEASLLTAGIEEALFAAREEVEGITMTSILFCKHGGLVVPVKSGQIPGISKRALRALIALEVFDEYSKHKQYLVIEHGKLTGIKPHLAGDGYVTVAFGDCLMGNDLEFYLEEFRKNGIEDELSDKVEDFNDIKDTVIPVDICFKKLLLDVEYYYQDAIKDFQEAGIKLSQNQLDAIVIAKYQCFSIGEKAFEAVKEGKDRETLFKLFLEAHGKNGNYKPRTNVEMNIYFDSDYTVEGELTDVIVEPLENLSEY